MLRVCTSTDGQRLAELTLDAIPVFDGLIAAHDRLFLSATDGKVACFGVP